MPEQVGELANELLGFPRHLGIHSGGMVICDRPVAEVVPVEWARMDGRTVVQWDKDDCAAVGLVKFDLLGLGMLTALHLMIDLVAEHHGRRVALHELQPVDPEVYAMLSQGDSVGVFQVESRAQIATLPRLRPRKFYDLVVEVALIRPGPIQGGSVHPYIRRRNGQEKWKHDHPLLENALEKTLGVPLFQEQLMQVAVDVAGFSPGEADELRRAMGAKRSTERMERLRGRFYEGMAANGIEGALADKIFDRMLAFANFGFPESHSISFASLVYYSAWFKLYHPSAFCAALLNAQPMGFYSPQSLVADARRHGVRVRGPDVNLGGSRAVLQPDAHSAGGQAVRLGMAGIRTIGEKLGEQIEVERTRDGPYRDLADLARRVRLTVPQAEALATAGALGSFGVDRRAALWAAGVVAAVRPEQLPGTAVGLDAPALPGMTAAELTVADVWASGVSPDSHPIVHLRERLDRFGALAIDRLDAVGRRAGPDAPPRVLVGGLVTHRQRPATAGGVTFLNLEDETGMLNVTCSEGLWHRYRTVALGSAALLVRGRLERSEEGVLNLVADRLTRLVLAVPVSRATSAEACLARLPCAQPFRRTRRSTRRRSRLHRCRPVRPRARRFTGRWAVWHAAASSTAPSTTRTCAGWSPSSAASTGARSGAPSATPSHRGSAFRSCTFGRTTLSGAAFTGCSLLGSTLLDSRVRPLTLTDCDLTLVALGGIDLRRTDLSGLRMREANLVEADLREADLRGTDLTGARLRGTRLDGADLRGARLEAGALAGAGWRARPWTSRPRSPSPQPTACGSVDLTNGPFVGTRATRLRIVVARAHAERAVHADRLAVEVVVRGDHQHQPGVLLGTGQPLRERDARGQPRSHLVGHTRHHRRVDDPGGDRHHPDAVAGQIAGGGDGHADDSGLRGRVRDLPGLRLEGRDRGRVDHDAALPVRAGREPAHRRRGQPQHVERPHEVHPDDRAEQVEVVRAATRQDARRRRDARAVDRQAQLLPVVVDPGQGRAYPGLLGDVGRQQRHPVGYGRARQGLLQVQSVDGRTPRGQRGGRGRAQPRRRSGDQRGRTCDLHDSPDRLRCGRGGP